MRQGGHIRADPISSRAQTIILLPTTTLALRATQTVTLLRIVTKVKTPITIKHHQIIIKDPIQILIRTLTLIKTVSPVPAPPGQIQAQT